MVKLGPEHLRRLTRILEAMPLLGTYRGRYQLLQSAGLEKIIPQLDLEGEPFVVVSQIVQVLQAYGRVSYEHEALGVFLNTVKEFIGSADDEQAFIEFLMKQYDLMTPVKKQEDLGDWKGRSNSQDVLEKIVGENTLRHISFLRRGLEVSGAVGLIDVCEWVGTGFMISPNLMITNNHVLPEAQLLSKTTVRFNYQLTFDGSEERVKAYKATGAGLFHTNAELDYTIIELEGTPGKDWGIAPLNTDVPPVNSRVNIIQHPHGQPKQISFQNNFVEYADSTKVQYLTSTLPGSSGSPVFDDKWRAVALHHAGGMLSEPGTNRQYFRNEGIAIAAIMKNLPEEIRRRLNT